MKRSVFPVEIRWDTSKFCYNWLRSKGFQLIVKTCCSYFGRSSTPKVGRREVRRLAAQNKSSSKNGGSRKPQQEHKQQEKQSSNKQQNQEQLKLQTTTQKK